VPSSTSSFSYFVWSYLVPWLAFTLAFALGTDYLFVQVIIPHSPGSSPKIKRLIEGNDPEEVGIFGSSRAEGNYMPEVLGHDVYNYGLSGVQFEATRVLLEIELAKPKRSPVIINFDPEFFDLPGIGDPVAYVPYCTRADFRGLLQGAGAYRPYYAIPGVRFFGSYETHLKEFAEGFSSPTHELVRGESLQKNRLPPNRFAALVAERLAVKSTFFVPALKDAAFQSLMNAHPERQFIVVVAPFHWSYYAASPDFPRVLEYATGLQRMHPNVLVLEFDGREMDDSLFFDTVHFNVAGARVFSEALRRRLDERGIHI
jgi:hypothetical protein